MKKYSFANITEDVFKLITEAYNVGDSLCICVGEGNRLGADYIRKLSKLGREYEDLVIAEVHIASFGFDTGVDHGYLIINPKQDPGLRRIIGDFALECGAETAWISMPGLDKYGNKTTHLCNVGETENTRPFKNSFLFAENRELYLVTRRIGHIIEDEAE